MSPLSQDLSTIASVPEIAVTAVTVENNPSTSKPYVEESDITPTTASLDSVTDMKTIAPTGSNIIPSITGMTDLAEIPTTSMVMDNNMPSMDHVSTTVVTLETTPATVTIPVTLAAMPSTIGMTTANEETNEVFKQPDEADSVVVATTPSIVLPTTLSAITTSMTITNDVNESFKQPEETVLVAETSTMSQPTPVPVQAETTTSSTLVIIPSELNEQSLNEIDNVLTMSSNEDTTRMASSTDNKIDNDVKQNEPPKSQETKNELEPGKNGCNSISISLAVLSTALLYVIA